MVDQLATAFNRYSVSQDCSILLDALIKKTETMAQEKDGMMNMEKFSLDSGKTHKEPMENCTSQKKKKIEQDGTYTLFQLKYNLVNNCQILAKDNSSFIEEEFILIEQKQFIKWSEIIALIFIMI